MLRPAILAFAFLLVFGGGTTFAETPQDPLAAGFQDPPNSARPRTWWHWMNGNITKYGIQKDLEWIRCSCRRHRN